MIVTEMTVSFQFQLQPGKKFSPYETITLKAIMIDDPIKAYKELEQQAIELNGKRTVPSIKSNTSPDDAIKTEEEPVSDGATETDNVTERSSADPKKKTVKDKPPF